MKFRETPALWRRGFALYRRRTGADSLGNETAWYDMTTPDETVEAARGISFQSPRGWNSAGSVGQRGWRVTERGETSGGVLEGYLKDGPVISPFDRLKVEDELWEVRAVYRWPGHRQLLMERVV